MPIDFDRLSSTGTSERIVDPIKLFRSLKVNDSAIQDLWLAQGDALRAWHEKRSAPDLAISLNTGAGKTLVGLLAAQSLVNEKSKKVIYACSSIQLVRQTEAKARGYGLPVTTYVERVFSNDLYDQYRAACITTYQALFNGLSRFGNERELGAIIFDDAHTAGNLLRDHFTLRIDHGRNRELYSHLSQLFRPYFTSINQEVGFLETINGVDRNTVRLFPPFAVREIFGEIQSALLSGSLTNDKHAKYPWAHLKNHVDLCAVTISSNEISFTPPVVPVNTLRYFQNDVQRLYLSATLNSQDGFLRTFGRNPDEIVAPETMIGNCERMILIPRLTDGGSRGNEIEITKAAVAPLKSLVLVPTNARQNIWEDIETVKSSSTDARVEEFKEALAPSCLLLTARYDGVDLPGDTCRVMIIDELPTGLNPLEKYLWEHLNLEKILRSTIASRVVQSFGRISRGTNDHGVVILTGGRLFEWLMAKPNLALLPPFLQQQLLVGRVFSEDVRSDELGEAIEFCLQRNPKWERYYEAKMESFDGLTEPAPEADEMLPISRSEVTFAKYFWNREYERAGKALLNSLQATFNASRPAGAWHCLWLGYCYQLMGDEDAAFAMYQQAKSSDHKIPAPSEKWLAEMEGVSRQATEVAKLLLGKNAASVSLPRLFDAELGALDGADTPRSTEAALQALGRYLGLDSSRPDNDLATGPDVLWMDGDGLALAMEAKTDKNPKTSTYNKEDLGQLRDHRQWVQDKFQPSRMVTTFVGPILPASSNSNPGEHEFVVELGRYSELRDHLRAAIVDICSNATSANVALSVQRVLESRGLLLSQILDSLPFSMVKELSH